MKSNLRGTILSIAGIAALSVAITMGVANAQGRDTDRAGQNQLQRGQQRGMPPQMMGGGGQAVMIQDGQNLYVLQGNQIYKLSKSDLDVVALGNLPMGMRGQRDAGPRNRQRPPDGFGPPPDDFGPSDGFEPPAGIDPPLE